MAREFVPVQVRFYDESLLEKAKLVAVENGRSLNAQILEFIKRGIEDDLKKQREGQN